MNGGGGALTIHLVSSSSYNSMGRTNSVPLLIGWLEDVIARQAVLMLSYIPVYRGEMDDSHTLGANLILDALRLG